MVLSESSVEDSGNDEIVEVTVTATVTSGNLEQLFLILEVTADGGTEPEDFAPDTVTSVSINLNATQATYSDDLGFSSVTLPETAFSSGAYSYEKLSGDSARLTYDTGSGGYSGTYDLTFTSATTGTFVENYTGPFTGTTSGTFEITSISPSN